MDVDDEPFLESENGFTKSYEMDGLGCSTKSMQAFESSPSIKSSAGDRMMVVVECEDTGVGLSEEARQTLFSPFKQAQRLAGGTGLGLFSLANRMEALHGHCGVRGRRDGGQGSLFWFAFPYKPDHEAAAAALECDLTAGKLASLGVQSHRRLTSGEVQLVTESTIDECPNFERKHTVRSLLTVMTDGLPQTASYNDTNSTTTTPVTATNWRVKQSPPNACLVTPRAVRQLPSHPLPAAPRTSPWQSCPASPNGELDRSGGSARFSGSSQSSPLVDGELLCMERTLHILLVDDTPSILKICSRTLLREGYRVSTAENGFEALKLLQVGRYDAVLMDLQMPVLDGFETIRRFRASEVVPPGRRRQFVVAVSANSEAAVGKGVIDGGFDGFIEKPFTMKCLKAILPADLGV